MLVCGSIVAAGGHVSAQSGGHSHEGHSGHSHGNYDHAGELLAFQLPQWKEMHFEDTAKARQHVEVVKKLGCEVKQGSHAGHIDVSYRCADWKSLAVKNHDLSEQWAGWLKAAGFDVSHGHTDPAFAEGAEVVEFRKVQWKQLHGTGSPGEGQMIDQLKNIGCEVVVENHGNHSDVRFRAPVWRDIHVADHATAEQWTAWLRQRGFETRHKH